MHLLTTEAFRGLLSAHPAPCVSLYLPTEHGPRAADHNRLRYEHLLDRALNGPHVYWSARDIAPVLEPLAHLPASELWDTQRAGVAAFASPRFAAHYALFEPPEELVIVSDSFHVRPLIAELEANRHYFLLSFSQQHARLFRGSQAGLAPVDVLAGVAFVGAARGERERSSTWHAAGSGFSRSVRHGHVGDFGRHAELERYLRDVDRIVQRELAYEKAPLVLAAPKELQAAYRQAARYAHIAETGLTGSFDGVSTTELHAKAWPIVRAELAAREDRMLEDFGSLAAHGRASADVAEIARCAVQGRVRELFLAAGRHVWGHFDRETGAVDLAPGGALVKGDDVLDDVAEAVLARGGEVLSLEHERMPRAAPLAALLRW